MDPEEFTALEDAGGAAGDGCDELQWWDDRRLVETYRRLSRDIRERGFDERTVHRMGCVEEELRTRDIDPDAIARAVDDARD
jgi:hypothetical protein